MSRRTFDYPPSTEGNYKRGENIASSIFGALATISALLVVKGASYLSSVSENDEPLKDEPFILTPKKKFWMPFSGVVLVGLFILSLYLRAPFLGILLYISSIIIFTYPLFSTLTKDYIFKSATYIVAQLLALCPILGTLYRERVVYGSDQSLTSMLEQSYHFPTLVYIIALLPFAVLIITCIDIYFQSKVYKHIKRPEQSDISAHTGASLPDEK